MNNICPKCGRVIAYDPYFKAYVCRQCGWMEDVPQVKKVKTYKVLSLKKLRTV